jgi:glutamate/tyrosine decarboxylase-like PLP-dependent enzyme
VYASTQAHGWLDKGLELLGLGSSAARYIGVDDAYRIDLDALRDAIRTDRAAGARPICIVATAGSVNTGAIDDLRALASLAHEEGLWLHVDGAFGALARLSPALRYLVDGLELADSIGFDLHKWGYLPFDCACVLVRDGDMHRSAFASSAPYLAQTERGVMAGGLPFANLGIDLTRSFKALKAWMSLKAYGVNRLARLIEQNVEQARYLAQRVERDDKLELLAPVSLNVVCFRYAPGDVSPRALDAINEELLLQLQERGIAVPSSTVLDGRFALRAAIVNHRSRREDFDALVNASVTIGDEIAARM